MNNDDAILMYDDAIDSMVALFRKTKDLAVIRREFDMQIRKMTKAGLEDTIAGELRDSFIHDLSFEVSEVLGLECSPEFLEKLLEFGGAKI